MADDSSTPDPLTQWRQLLSQSERQLNAAFNELMSTEQFKASQARIMDAFLGFQRAMNERMREYWMSVGVPSREEVLALGERLESIEERLRVIESHLGGEKTGETERPRQRTPRPKRTRKPPAAGSR